MKNRSKAGNAFQDWCEDWILKNHAGSVVHNQKAVARAIPMKDPKTGKIEPRWVSQRNDILGCIDLVWVDATGHVTFIQATEDSGIGRKLKELNAVPWAFGRGYGVQIWVKRKPGVVAIMDVVRMDMKALCSSTVAMIERGKFRGYF